MLLSFILVLLSSLLLSASAGFLSALFPIAFAVIILNLEILSLFGAINTTGIITINVFTFLISAFVWYKTGLKIPRPNFIAFFKKIFNSLKLDKSLAVLTICFIFLMVVSFLISLYTPANEGDAKAYHIFRAIMFSDMHRITHFDTNEIRNLVMPVNSEIIYTWIYTFTRQDVGFSLLSFFSYLFAITSLWGILGHFGFCTRKKLWAVFILSSLAGIIAQISSTQSDLLAGSLLLGGINFFIRQGKASIYLAALCTAIAAGTKSTAVMAMISVVFFMLVYSYKTKTLNRLWQYFGFFVINFIIFSSYNYILNFLSFNNPLGSNASIIAHHFWGGIKAFFANILRYFLQMFDFSGFTWGYYLNDSVMGAFNKILAFFGINPQLGANIEFKHLNCFLTEQTMGYGILGWLVFLPCAVLSLFKGGDKKREVIRLFGIMFFINIVILSFSVAYMIYSIRFIASFIVLSSPVFVLSYCKKMNPLKFIVILFSIFYMTLVSTHLSQRPFFKLQKEFKRLERQEFNTKTRCESFKFYRSNTGTCQLANYIKNNYKGRLKIGFFLDSSTVLTPLKFLEKSYNGAYGTNFLNMAHIGHYNLEDFDLIVTNDNIQKITALYKYDEIKFNYRNENGKIIFNENVFPACAYIDKDLNIVYTKKEIVTAVCLIEPQYFKNKGFTKQSVFKPKYLDYDKERVWGFYLFSKQ